MVPIEQKDWTEEDRASKLGQNHPLDSTKRRFSLRALWSTYAIMRARGAKPGLPTAGQSTLLILKISQRRLTFMRSSISIDVRAIRSIGPIELGRDT